MSGAYGVVRADWPLVASERRGGLGHFSSMPIRIGTSEISSGFSKGEGKSPDGPRLPIGVGGGQVVLDSQRQADPSRLQGQDAPAI